MKLKFDYVTNSSSCSFVMVGVKTTFKEIKKILKESYGENWEDMDLDRKLPNGLSFMFEPEMIGRILSEGSSDDYGMESSSTPVEEIEKYANIISNFLNVDKSEVKLYTGERNC